MPPLKNVKHEKCAQGWFLGQKYDYEVYQEVYNCSLINAQKSAAKLRNTAEIEQRMAELNQECANEAIATKQELAEIYSQIVRSTPADFVTCGADGTWINVGLDSCNKHAIQDIQSTTVYKGKGDDSYAAVVTDLKLQDKVKAGKALAELMGYNMPQEVKHTGAVGVVNMTIEQLMEIAAGDDDNDN